MNVRRAVAVAAVLAVGCSSSQPKEDARSLMNPGSDCLTCHDGTTAARFTVAGTFQPPGASVSIVDAVGNTLPVTTNSAGNFFVYPGNPTLVFPLRVSVDTAAMPGTLTYGGCNACHAGTAITTGPEMSPGVACLTCHGPAGMATTKLTAAGTFAPAGLTVQVGGQATTTNAVGNFYITGPITFPAAAQVGGSSMQGGAPHGDCNQCHGG